MKPRPWATTWGSDWHPSPGPAVERSMGVFPQFQEAFEGNGSIISQLLLFFCKMCRYRNLQLCCCCRRRSRQSGCPTAFSWQLVTYLCHFSGDLTRNLSEGRHILAHVKFTLELECGEMNCICIGLEAATWGCRAPRIVACRPQSQQQTPLDLDRQLCTDFTVFVSGPDRSCRLSVSLPSHETRAILFFF